MTSIFDRLQIEFQLSDSTVATALADFQRHTLAFFRVKLGALVYVASLRDYNTGQYHHDGLTTLYGSESSHAALWSSHKQLFAEVVEMKASELLADFSEFISEANAGVEQVLESWQVLKAYQTLIPLDADQVSAELFISTMNITLVILRLRGIRRAEAGTSSKSSLASELENCHHSAERESVENLRQSSA